ncbi:MAG: HAMP domain-containing sensor histidine kinase [Dehalobacterium sp.]
MEASKAGQTLTVKVYQKEHSFFLEIQDTGSGISAAVIDKIGTPFVDAKEEHGSGLGLTICYSIVKRYQGEIWFKTGP